MAALSPILRSLSGGLVAFWCPGCDCAHQVKVDGPYRWEWNGDTSKPTFSPSILVRWEANPAASEELKQWRTERRCHSFVRDGQIQFLDDCTHSLRGKTVSIPPWPLGED
jgi:hypothetical protein